MVGVDRLNPKLPKASRAPTIPPYGQREMTDWKPIETGPKDGRRVKLLIPYNTSLYSESECTDEGYWQPIKPGRKASIGMGVPQWGVDDGGCWRFDGDDGAYDMQPTHWKPL